MAKQPCRAAPLEVGMKNKDVKMAIIRDFTHSQSLCIPVQPTDTGA